MKAFVYIALMLLCLPVLADDTLSVKLQKQDVSCGKGAASLSISGGTQPYSIAWSSGQSGLSADQLEAGNYSVTVQDASGHDTSLYFSIGQEPCPVGIPNHFTPNGDGYNDVWSLSNIAHYPNFELVVFNRWGQTVHRQQQSYVPWDGTQLGVNLPDAGYFYIFYYDKDDHKNYLKGDVSILR